MNVTKLKETMKEEKLETRRQIVNEIKNVCTTKSWANVCGGDIVFYSYVMHVMNEGKIWKV